MSRSLRVHEKKDTVKWWLAGIAIVLIMAILGWLIAAAIKDINAVCLFKHHYGEDNKCTRCGADKPVEEPEPQAFESEPMTFYASAAQLASDGIAAKAEDVPLGCRRLRVGDVIDENTVLFVDVVTPPANNTDSGFIMTTIYSTDTGYNKFLYLSKMQDYISLNYDGCPEEFADSTDRDEFLEYVYEPMDWGFVQDNLYDVRQGLSNFPKGTVTYASEYVYIQLVGTELPPAPTKTGYTFTGWYTDEACTNKYTEDKVYGDITLYAGFQANTYEIKFNANSGSGTMANEAMTYDQAKALTANVFTKDHYQFKGWATSADGEVVYANNAEVNNLTTEDAATVELFAVWQRSEVCVTFVSEDNTVATTWIAIGTKATLPENPVKEGHLFDGWYYEDGSKYEEQNISEDVTLTAKFSIIRCTVTFMVDGEVYAVYVCDWGTSIAQALNGAGVNTALYKADEHSRNF